MLLVIILGRCSLALVVTDISCLPLLIGNRHSRGNDLAFSNHLLALLQHLCSLQVLECIRVNLVVWIRNHPLLRRLNLHLVVARGVLSCMADRVLIMVAICLCSEATWCDLSWTGPCGSVLLQLYREANKQCQVLPPSHFFFLSLSLCTFVSTAAR